MPCRQERGWKDGAAQRNAGPQPSQAFDFDETIDYPRRFSTRFDDRHPDGRAEVIRTWWRLEEADKAAVEERFGAGVLQSDTFQAHFGFRYDKNQRIWHIEVDSAKALENLVDKHALDATERNVLHGVIDGPTAYNALSGLATRTPKQEALLNDINECRESSFIKGVLDVLSERQPAFFFTSHFERMSGMISIQKLKDDQANNTVSVGRQDIPGVLGIRGHDCGRVAQCKSPRSPEGEMRGGKQRDH